MFARLEYALCINQISVLGRKSINVEVTRMCDKCRPKKHKRYWLHIADDWNQGEQEEMLAYLTKKLEQIHRQSKAIQKTEN
jgi:hypothetical protein